MHAKVHDWYEQVSAKFGPTKKLLPLATLVAALTCWLLIRRETNVGTQMLHCQGQAMDDFYSTQADIFTDGCMRAHSNLSDVHVDELDLAQPASRACRHTVNMTLLEDLHSAFDRSCQHPQKYLLNVKYNPTRLLRSAATNFGSIFCSGRATATVAPARRKPNILVLIIDSLSRQEMNAYLPRVRNELQGLSKSAAVDPQSAHVFSFGRATALGQATAFQITPLLAGHSFHTPTDDLAGHWLTDILVHPTSLNNTDTKFEPAPKTTEQTYKFAYLYCWEFFINYGFTKVHGSQMIDRAMNDADILWHKRCVNHTAIAWSNTPKQRNAHDVVDHGDYVCPRKKSQHTEAFHLAEHLANFWRREAAHPKFAVLHSLASHFPQSAKTISLYEDALLETIRAAVKADDTVVLLMSDHGNTRVSHTYDLPYLNMVVPRWVLTHEQAAAMHANTQVMVSMYDVHATLRALGGCPPPDGISLASVPPGRSGGPAQVCGSGVPLHPTNATNGLSTDDKRPARPGYVLFGSYLPRNRSCRDVGVPDDHCPCARWHQTNEPPQGSSAIFLREVTRRQLIPVPQELAPSQVTAVGKLDKSTIRVQSCPTLRAANITKIRRSDHGHWKLEIASDFKRRFEMRLKTTGGQPRLIGLKQLTSYTPDKKCAPPGADPEFCLCARELVPEF